MNKNKIARVAAGAVITALLVGAAGLLSAGSASADTNSGTATVSTNTGMVSPDEVRTQP